MSEARGILEAETPKGFLRQAPPPSIVRPMPFKQVQVGEWFRLGKWQFKRVYTEDDRPTYQEAEVMSGPTNAVGERWTFDPESEVFPLSFAPEQAKRHQ